jgi:hypothetical protein
MGTDLKPCLFRLKKPKALARLRCVSAQIHAVEIMNASGDIDGAVY